MPSMEQPTVYTRNYGMMPSEFDNFFKWAVGSIALETTGTCDSPVGFVSLIKIESPHEVVQEYIKDSGDESPTRWNMVTPGWYVTREDDRGFIWALCYGEDYVLNEEKARADFAEADQVYSVWDNEQEEDQFDESECDCGTPAGFHTSDCAGHVS